MNGTEGHHKPISAIALIGSNVGDSGTLRNSANRLNLRGSKLDNSMG
jgi:hypothetical protein